MAREMERTVQQSVLDRLMDDEPGVADSLTVSWGESVRALKASLRRDLEWLLNTRRIPQPLPEACEEVGRSLYLYGLPDFTALSRDDPDTPRLLAREVERAITLFEPRLEGTRVVLGESETGGARRLHFVIEAMLKLDPTPERVVFDTVLDLANHDFAVQSGAPGTG